jgi:hypothetical protein
MAAFFCQSLWGGALAKAAPAMTVARQSATDAAILRRKMERANIGRDSVVAIEA